MTELTEREKEFELFGMGLDDLEKLVKTKAEERNVPVAHVLIDWLELAQYQIEDRYRNVHHIINRLVYVLQSGMVIDNPNFSGKSETVPAAEEKPSEKNKD